MSDIDNLFKEISRLNITVDERANFVSHFINTKQIQPNVISDTLTGLSHFDDDGKIALLRKLVHDMRVHIYIDNSNFFRMGSQVVANELEKLNVDFKLLSSYIDYNRLIKIVLKGRKPGRIFIVSSAPPYMDRLWNRLKDHYGYDVEIIKQDRHLREKGVDTTLVVEATEDITLSKYSNILALVAGDGDYEPLLRKTRKYNWQVETHFWNEGMSKNLKDISSYHYPLNDHYKSFWYFMGDHKRCEYTLRITGNKIKNHKWNENLMECFNTLELHGWWDWKNNDTALLYFNNSKQLEDAENFLRKYSEIGLQRDQSSANLSQQQATEERELQGNNDSNTNLLTNEMIGGISFK
uniref:Transposase for insertion sequence element IS1328 n=1 Tax=Anthurium amnicola TaxID=1678845 RepID=A0A1D1ZJX9_9ARAE